MSTDEKAKGTTKTSAARASATASTKKASTKNAETTTLPAAAEKKVRSVADEFPAGDVRTAAERYARKVLKQKAGLRSSTPPTTGLTKEQAEQIRDALGLSKPVEATS